jgi:hypothetical protein
VRHVWKPQERLIFLNETITDCINTVVSGRSLAGASPCAGCLGGRSVAVLRWQHDHLRGASCSIVSTFATQELSALCFWSGILARIQKHTHMLMNVFWCPEGDLNPHGLAACKFMCKFCRFSLLFGQYVFPLQIAERGTTASVVRCRGSTQCQCLDSSPASEPGRSQAAAAFAPVYGRSGAKHHGPTLAGAFLGRSSQILSDPGRGYRDCLCPPSAARAVHCSGSNRRRSSSLHP